VEIQQSRHYLTNITKPATAKPTTANGNNPIAMMGNTTNGITNKLKTAPKTPNKILNGSVSTNTPICKRPINILNVMIATQINMKIMNNSNILRPLRFCCSITFYGRIDKKLLFLVNREQIYLPKITGHPVFFG
jgi:hypothetical protein